MRRRSIRYAVPALCALALAGCAGKEGPDDGTAPAPSATTYQVTREANLEVKLADKGGKDPGYRMLRVRKPDGEVIAQGAVSPEHPYALNYPLPSYVTELRVQLGDQERRVTIDDHGTAQVTFE